MKTLKLNGVFELRKLSDSDRIVAGYASDWQEDSDGELIPRETQLAWWSKYIQSEYPIITMFHDDVPVGRVLPEFKDSMGVMHKSGVDDRGLYVITQLRKDTRTADELWQQIQQWGGRGAYSISANIFGQPITQTGPKGNTIRIYPPESGELNSITIGREGANDRAIFQIVKLRKPTKRTLVVR